MTFTPEESGEIFKRDKMGRVRVPRARREALLDEYERNGISGVQFANYVGIKYSTLANWIQERRGRGRIDKSQVKGGEGAQELAKANSLWVEAVIDKNSGQRAPEGTLRIYFAAGAYCQIGNAREAGLAAELIGRLGAKGC
jgi:hypothetical protein